MAGEEEEDDDDATIARMERLLGLKKGEDRVNKELRPSGLDYLLSYMDDAKAMRERGELASDEEQPEEVSARQYGPPAGKQIREYENL